MILATLVVTASPAFAQAPEDACAAFAWPIADAKAAMMGDIAKVASGAAAPHDFELSLAPTEQVPFPMKPERAPKQPGTFGGFVTLDAPKGAMLQVTASDDAWIDVARGGAFVKSAAFSGKGGCAGVRKTLRFPLGGSGPLTLQVSGAPVQAIRVDVRGVE